MCVRGPRSILSAQSSSSRETRRTMVPTSTGRCRPPGADVFGSSAGRTRARCAPREAYAVGVRGNDRPRCCRGARVGGSPLLSSGSRAPRRRVTARRGPRPRRSGVRDRSGPRSEQMRNFAYDAAPIARRASRNTRGDRRQRIEARNVTCAG